MPQSTPPAIPAAGVAFSVGQDQQGPSPTAAPRPRSGPRVGGGETRALPVLDEEQLLGVPVGAGHRRC
ncbi:hypothetical protein [Streptomyces sp. NPDC126503]|uniref:hypothetical protein n=1 Tax=Streptomyces sp. NPDC126503 TaxID=3155315 RepID=UPI003322D6C3